MAAISRRIALSVLNALDESNATLDTLLARSFGQGQVDHRDRALATELVFGTLRWQGRLDWVLQFLSNIPLHKIEPRILSILRLGLYQILFLSRIPPWAAVNDSVELARETAPRWVVRFVNAVLRSAVRKAKQTPMPDPAKNPITSIVVEEAYPPWLVERWADRLGVEATRLLCRANNRIPPVSIRTNTLRVSREELLDYLGPLVDHVEPSTFSPEGILLRGLKEPIGAMPAFQQGWFQVQDEAAQLISYLVGPRPGETILDACAGLGGKTSHMAQIMGDMGEITAVDNHVLRLSKLETSMTRLGISSVTVRRHDLQTPFAENLAGPFDRILLDAPCSGLGVIRRNPDIKWRKGADDLVRVREKQERILACMAPLVKEGGRLVYCVCSLEPEEGEAVVEGFLKSFPVFVIEDPSIEISEIARRFVDRAGIFKILPQEHAMDGFFAVRLRRLEP